MDIPVSIGILGPALPCDPGSSQGPVLRLFTGFSGWGDQFLWMNKVSGALWKAAQTWGKKKESFDRWRSNPQTGGGTGLRPSAGGAEYIQDPDSCLPASPHTQMLAPIPPCRFSFLVLAPSCDLLIFLLCSDPRYSLAFSHWVSPQGMGVGARSCPKDPGIQGGHCRSRWP